jgi:GTPase SAR1 family protein
VSWFSVKEQLETMKANKENYIPHSRYLEMCKAHNIDDSLDHKRLIGLLHDLGIVIHDQEVRRLQETNILNPEWVTPGIYRTLNANVLFQSKGVLAAADLDNIFDRKEYPTDKHDLLLGMMRKFELCFRFEGDDQTFLIPELLPKDEPSTGEDKEEPLGFEYHYPVLPGAVISRFIVRMHLAISQKKKTYWRTAARVPAERYPAGRCACVAGGAGEDRAQAPRGLRSAANPLPDQARSPATRAGVRGGAEEVRCGEKLIAGGNRLLSSGRRKRTAIALDWLPTYSFWTHR